jgi:hypothetical protein
MADTDWSEQDSIDYARASRRSEWHETFRRATPPDHGRRLLWALTACTETGLPGNRCTCEAHRAVR